MFLRDKLLRHSVQVLLEKVSVKKLFQIHSFKFLTVLPDCLVYLHPIIMTKKMQEEKMMKPVSLSICFVE